MYNQGIREAHVEFWPQAHRGIVISDQIQDAMSILQLSEHFWRRTVREL